MWAFYINIWVFFVRLRRLLAYEVFTTSNHVLGKPWASMMIIVTSYMWTLDHDQWNKKIITFVNIFPYMWSFWWSYFRRLNNLRMSLSCYCCNTYTVRIPHEFILLLLQYIYGKDHNSNRLYFLKRKYK